jgi:hypothetical protein
MKQLTVPDLEVPVFHLVNAVSLHQVLNKVQNKVVPVIKVVWRHDITLASRNSKDRIHQSNKDEDQLPFPTDGFHELQPLPCMILVDH